MSVLITLTLRLLLNTVLRLPTCRSTRQLRLLNFGVTQLLNLLRRTKEYQAKFAKRDYRWAPNISKELNQQTVGIVGAGHIGRVMAHICRGFGARVMVYNHRPKPDLVKAGVFTDSLDELYKESTVISLHVPAVKSTYHILNRDALPKCKRVF